MYKDKDIGRPERKGCPRSRIVREERKNYKREVTRSKERG